MIDSCGLHIGCFLTCTSGVNTLSVDLLATVSGTHEIEYHFLDRVIRFEIEATIGLPFEIPTTYFNESGDARIKIVLPDGSYYTHTVGTTVYSTFFLTVRSSQDSNSIPVVVIPPVVDGVAIPFVHSLVEQVWPFEKYLDGATIYVRTWEISAGAGNMPITGLTPDYVAAITNRSPMRYINSLGEAALNTALQIGAPALSSDPYVIQVVGGSTDNKITIWYTKP